MILNIVSQRSKKNYDRKNFIPFVNERDHMGNIINSKPRNINYTTKPEQILQNLKKNAKEYSFDRRMERMNNNLRHFQKSLEPKEKNWGQKVDECIKMVQKMQKMKQKSKTSEQYYVNLHEQLDDKIRQRRKQVAIKKHNKINTAIKQQSQQNLNISQVNEVQPTKNIVFNEITNKQSKIVSKHKNQNKSLMQNFTKCGMKYKYMVKCQKHHPWKKWYNNRELQLFPGQKIKVRILTKTLY